GVTQTDVIDMNRRLGGDASLNAAIREDGDSGEWQDWLGGESPDQETTPAARGGVDHRRKTLSEGLTVLNEREQRNVETGRLAEEQITLAELAEELGISRERVRQIEVIAFEKVQNAVKHRVAAMGSPALLQVRRSEEHTSELQSLTNLVCRLLLEKKKHKKQTHTQKQAGQSNAHREERDDS